MTKQQKEQVEYWLANAEYNRAYEELHSWLKENPDDADLNYLLASTCDSQGKEKEAYPYYEKAIKLGLGNEDLKGAYLGLGSTYRTLGMYEESKATFEAGLAKFPTHYALKVFYAMTLYNLKEYEQAMALLLTCLTETTKDEEILAYQKAISFYSGRLNDVWD
ncbi:tetratricopeptide repeat protein [Bacillus sp. Marseille-P3800]|uniref:tetratricopeptide repeat protein n=1 Tax=Bacillus sp. Marseille-P3800 TaxID=2014782 RepID=UPI0021006231|nr:tetratricopeptide repeat protein [Bacillus sp. Marseille-P3800]